uniref:Uncharacterized protein n=1 Tax=Brassica oleracea TaxID=3712 RepID=A0A3P6FSP8_BRAOL|nr:unnamed protein product [Brassica oleracea]
MIACRSWLGCLCLETSSADPLCLHWDLTRAPRITEVLEVEKKNNSVVTTQFGFSEELKHLVNPTHPDDKNFDSEKTQDEEEQQVEVDAEFGDGDKERETSKINETREEEEEQMEADTEVEEPVQVERQKRGRGNKINNSLSNEHKKNEEKRKDEAYEKAKEKFQDEDSCKLDKLIQMLVLESIEDDMMNNDATEITSSRESPSNIDIFAFIKHYKIKSLLKRF